MKKKLKIFGYSWHLAHNYELSKFPFADWSWLVNYKRSYAPSIRGDFMQDFVTSYEPGKYDVAILHIDQQCVEDSIWHLGKGSVYKMLNEVITDIPKIVINHGTPFYPEKFESDDKTKPNKEVIRRMRKVIGDNTMVVNSHKAREQWGWGNTIIHGLDPKEWWDMDKERRVITVLSPAGLDWYYDRNLLTATKELLAENGIHHCHVTVDYLSRNWDTYRDFLGRSLVYFNPTRESPMPRSRTEAMLSGCCVVTTGAQDADTFIEQGKNGFLIKRNPQLCVDVIMECLNNYDMAVDLGQAGKRTAMKLFNQDRYHKNWEKLINDVLNEFHHGKKSPYNKIKV